MGKVTEWNSVLLNQHETKKINQNFDLQSEHFCTHFITTIYFGLSEAVNIEWILLFLLAAAKLYRMPCFIIVFMIKCHQIDPPAQVVENILRPVQV